MGCQVALARGAKQTLHILPILSADCIASGADDLRNNGNPRAAGWIELELIPLILSSQNPDYLLVVSFIHLHFRDELHLKSVGF